MYTRYLSEYIKKDTSKKIILLSGPRQVGKTVLARALFPDSHDYLNYDIPESRLLFKEKSWRRDVALVVFDELHKMKKWKLWLKGIYDGEGIKPAIIVTGSARLDIARKMGDSLAGRHFLYHLHPLDLKELDQTNNRRANFDRLLQIGGFPEPFYSTEQGFIGKWRRSHLDLILRQDLIDLEQVRQITQLELLVQLLRERVGTPISVNALSEDLQVDHSTVKRWLVILENLFVIYRLNPWSKNIPRAIRKSAKYYFYDSSLPTSGIGASFENLVANSLLKEIQFQQDVMGREIALYYVRNHLKEEIDFAVVENRKVIKLIEAKFGDDQPSPHFKTFGHLLPQSTSGKMDGAIQLVGEGGTRERDYPFGLSIRDGVHWLAQISL